GSPYSTKISDLQTDPWKGALDTDRVFLSRRGNGLSRQQAYRIVREAGEKAGMTIEINPKMLRHACGFGLAERGAGTCLIQDFLGHRNARHTKKYTESDDSPFIDLWQDTWGGSDDKTKGCNESVDGEEPCEKGNSWGQTDT
ncbi:TPA: tyrosine-type recombinase/integrase, partial [Enterobacter cloacae]